MVLNVLALKGFRYLTQTGFEHPFKEFNKFLRPYLSKYQLKCSREYTNENNTDVLDTIQMQKYLYFLVNEKPQSNDQIVKLVKDKMNIEEEIKTLEKMSSEGDEEFKRLIESEKKIYAENIQEIKEILFHSLISLDEENDNRNVELHIQNGIGGEEAKIFSEELFQMYINYAKYKNWELFRFNNYLLISGEYVFNHLKYEAGVHRVQRVPETEKAGRTHTSTCSVIILPQPKPTEIQISEKDLIIERIKSSGPGGQNVNKRETCVRIKHKPTGLVVESQTERYQYSNLKCAIDRLRGILYNLEQEKILQERKTLRKDQAGINDYSDKIRTYHYSNNRVTDHRINFTTYNLKGFLEGNKDLDLVINQVKEHNKKKELLLHVENVLQSEKYRNFEKKKKQISFKKSS